MVLAAEQSAQQASTSRWPGVDLPKDFILIGNELDDFIMKSYPYWL